MSTVPTNDIEMASSRSAAQIVPQNVPAQNVPVQNEIQHFSGQVRADFAPPILTGDDHDPLSPSAPCYPLNTISYFTNSSLGSGSFGICYMVFNTIVGLSTFKQDNQADTTRFQATEKEKMRRREFDAIFRLNHHPNVVSFFGYVIEDEKGPKHPIGTLMEFMAGGDIEKYVKEHVSKPDEFPLPPVLQNTWAKQIALGLNFIHWRNVMHRDIKPNNILLSHDRRVAKIADFGLSKNLEKEPGNQHTRKIGNWMYSAPEIHTGEEYDKSVDVYSYAMVLYFIYYQKHPFDPKKNSYTYLERIKGDGNTPPLRPDLSTPPLPIDGLIENCWLTVPDQRMTMPEVIAFLFSDDGQQLLPALNA